MNDTLEGMLNQLKEYSKELGTNSMSLSTLIDAHRAIRMLLIEDRIKEHERIRNDITEGVKAQLFYNYVDTNTFFDLPLKEIINRYYNDET